MNSTHSRPSALLLGGAALGIVCSLPTIARAQNADWMGQIVHSYTYLSELTIPGRHDSAATDDPAALPGTTAAQTSGITAQLNHGVRFLDIRLREGNVIDFDDPLVPAHGPFLQPGSIGTLFDELSEFLSLHPHEMILVSIKHERDPTPRASNISSGDFQGLVESFLSKSAIAALFSDEAVTPQYTYGTGSTAGRLVLIRRYSRPNGGAAPVASIDATDWPEDATADAGASLHVQDEYQYACDIGLSAVNIPACLLSVPPNKYPPFERAFVDALETAGVSGSGLTWSGQIDRLRLNFASATMVLRPGVGPVGVDVPLPPQGTIPAFARYMNPRIEQLARTWRGRAGVVVLDYETEGLVGALVNMNRKRPFEYDGRSSTASRNAATGSVLYRNPSGSVLDLGGVTIGSPAVSGGANASQMSVFAIGTDRSLYTKWQTAPGSKQWSNWTDLGGILTSNPAVVRLCSGVMQVFARGNDGALWTTWQTTAGGHWSEWLTLGGIIRSRPWTSLSGCDATVTAIGADGAEWSRRRSAATGQWGDWTKR